MAKFDEQGRWKEPTDEQMYKSGRKWLWIIVALVVLAPVIGFGVKWATADLRGKGAAREQIKANPNFRIAAYQTFFDLCSSVQAQEDRITIFSPRAESGDETAQTNLDAVRANRAALIREYNAKASRTYTEGQFRDSDLPYQLDPNNEETTCKAS